MVKARLKLGVNVDHVATLRQLRGTPYPDPAEAARLCARAGAHGITVHLREDRRHIQDRDVVRLRREHVLPLNLEMAVHPDMVHFAERLRPAEACLVPERRQELTTEGGLDAAGRFKQVARVVDRLGQAGIEVSLFIEAARDQIRAAAEMGAPCVELHTGRFAHVSSRSRRKELDRLVRGARLAHDLGLRVNAGHGIHLGNIEDILKIPHLDTLNIGHSLVARAVFVGIGSAVREMLNAMSAYRGGRR